MKLKIKLTEESINKAIEELEQYKNSLPNKLNLFIERLSEVGIEMAENCVQVPLDDMGNMGMFVEFSCQIESNKEVVIGKLIGRDKAQLVNSWLSKDPDTKQEYVKTAELSRLLFYEFGAGLYAIDGHRGTFPSDNPETTKEHADNGWYYKDLDGKWYHSYGTMPTQPMFHAWEDMKKRIRKIGKEVFKE